jgi:6-pyruvoyltetrahydropterin/6-carboxytetrahydropterin synthase
MEIYKDFNFDSAHFLPNVPEGHKCKRLHGHTYHLRVYISGTPNNEVGWIMDFGELKSIVKPIIDELDHNYLNEIPGLENPTSELLVKWIWNRLKPLLPQLSRIALKETCTSGCMYSGE